ncbi:MAG: (deoxy)nucleoside triphosphate pyrophosphohydrolase [Nitrospirae bacterium]|nr:(deoxy)nucleoside triphosphate pyrophosphohydrolase [Nitrospirota bacterium]
MSTQVVAAAIIIQEGKILISRRKKNVHLGRYWEFPGGKKNEKEELTDTLIREVREELGIGIKVGEEAIAVTYRYPDRTVELHFYFCEWKSGTCQALECDEYLWIEKSRMDEFTFPPATSPLIKMLMSELN